MNETIEEALIDVYCDSFKAELLKELRLDEVDN